MNITPWGENSEQSVQEFEKQIGFKLPDDHYQFLVNNNGADVNKQCFFVKGLDQKILMDIFYGITNDEDRSLTLGFWMKEYQDEINENELVIGSDPGGHQILYITTGEDKGIYYWDTNHFFVQSRNGEGDTYFVAETFTEFCSLLTD